MINVLNFKQYIVFIFTNEIYCTYYTDDQIKFDISQYYVYLLYLNSTLNGQYFVALTNKGINKGG